MKQRRNRLEMQKRSYGEMKSSTEVKWDQRALRRIEMGRSGSQESILTMRKPTSGEVMGKQI